MTTGGSVESWDLTAPESLVLRDGPGADRALAIKLGLLELIGRGSLRLIDAPGRSWLGRPRIEKVLVAGHRPLPHTGALAPISVAYHNTATKAYADGTSGRAIPALAQTLARGGRTRGKGYIQGAVLPELAGRGLYVQHRDRVLGVLPRTRWRATPDGERLRGELLRLLEDGERSVTGGAADPREATRFLAAAGAAPLLMTAAYSELAELSRRHRQSGSAGDGGSTFVVTSTGDGPGEDGSPSTEPSPQPSESDAAGWESAAPAFDVDAVTVGSLDLAAFDGIDSAFDAIDSGVDAGGGGDGGGDGGDGGGGGGD